MLDKTKVSRMVKKTFYLLCPLPFFLRILKEIESITLKKRAKRGGVIKHKMCFLGYYTIYTNGKKHHFNPIHSSFVIAVPLLFTSPFNSKNKAVFIWVPWHFWHFLYGNNTHFILQDTFVLSRICQKCQGILWYTPCKLNSIVECTVQNCTILY